jgi:threonine synthase
MTTVVSKKDATKSQRLLYLEQLSQTLMGLHSANQALLARRAHAGAEESRAIDIYVSQNNSEWAKASAAQALYFTEDAVRFRPPSDAEVAEMKALVTTLDGIIAANTTASAIMQSATELVNSFHDTQVA